MSQILKTRRLVNPGRRRRKRNAGKKRLTLAQKLHFGTKRQRAAAKASLHRKRSNPAKRRYRRASNAGTRRRRSYAAPRRRRHTRRARARNVGKIITIRPLPATSNPGRKRRKKGYRATNSMAKRRRRTRRRTNAGNAFGRSWSRRRYRARPKGIRSNPGHRRRSYRRRRNSPRVVVRYRNAHRRRRVGGRRRNPGMMTGDFSTAVQIVGGAIVTKFVTDMLPASIASGIPGYIATAVVAVLQGKAIGKLLRNPTLGKNMTIGGFVYLSLRLAQDFLPSIGLPFRLGIVGPSSFYTPQVPLMGNMGAFVPPAGLLAAMPHTSPSGMTGLTQRRVGRMR